MSESVAKTLFDYFVVPAVRTSDDTFDNFVDTILHVEVEVNIEEVIPSPTTSTPCTGYRYAVASAASNDPTEDRTAVICDTDLSLFAVFDGHGGNLACEIATATLADNIKRRIQKLGPDASAESLRAAIEDAYQQCDDLILREAQHIVSSNMIAAATTNGNDKFSSRRSQTKAKGISSATPRANMSVDSSACRSSGLSWNGSEYFAVTGKKPERAGSCAVMAVLRGRDLMLSHVGDCRAFRLARPKCATSACLNGAISNGSLESMVGNTPNHLRRSPRKKIFPATIKMLNTVESSTLRGVTETGFVVECLTIDHCCEQEEERGRVMAITTDPAPFRPSRGDVETFGQKSAPMRVAGSLSVTRALGDGYLKLPDLSVLPYSTFVPYITCHPTVRHLTLEAQDFGFILASDGFWNNVDIYETVMIVEEEMLQNTADISSAVISASLSGLKRKRTQSITDIHISSSAEDLTVMTVSSDSLEQRIANALLKKCVKNAAAASRIPLKLLKKMPPGQQRRNLVDDITIMVVLFDEGEACDH